MGSSNSGDLRDQQAWIVIEGNMADGMDSASNEDLLREQMEAIFGDDSDGLSGRTKCSMCGDVGFQDQLLRCSYCHEHVQHRYCSTSYKELRSDASSWVCDWCFPSQKPMIEVEKQESPKKWSSSSPRSGRTHIGLDLLIEVAWGSSEKVEISQPGSAKGTHRNKETQKETVQRSSSSDRRDGSSTKQIAATCKKRQGSSLERWPVCQKTPYSLTRDGFCGRSGMQILERVSSAKGLGRRYRLLSSMLC